jgi:hypothetical protein
MGTCCDHDQIQACGLLGEQNRARREATRIVGLDDHRDLTADAVGPPDTRHRDVLSR